MLYKLINTETINDNSNNLEANKLTIKRKKIESDSGRISYNNKENNYLWIIDDESKVTLELVQSTTEMLPKDLCVYYSLDLFILPIESIVDNLMCGNTNDQVQEFKLPNEKINIEVKVNSNSESINYHEHIKSGYFSPYQINENFISNNHFNGIQYTIEIDIPETKQEYNLRMELGYDHKISLFDAYLSKLKKIKHENTELDAIKKVPKSENS